MDQQPSAIFSPEQLQQHALQAELTQQTPPESKDRLRVPRWAALLGSNVFDALSTSAALKGNPQAREANPALRGIAGNPLALLGIKGGVGLLEALLMDKLAKKSPKAANITGFGIAGANTALGINNLSKRK